MSIKRRKEIAVGLKGERSGRGREGEKFRERSEKIL